MAPLAIQKSSIGGQINTTFLVEFGEGCHPVGREPPEQAIGHNL